MRKRVDERQHGTRDSCRASCCRSPGEFLRPRNAAGARVHRARRRGRTEGCSRRGGRPAPPAPAGEEDPRAPPGGDPAEPEKVGTEPEATPEDAAGADEEAE